MIPAGLAACEHSRTPLLGGCSPILPASGPLLAASTAVRVYGVAKPELQSTRGDSG